jgi:hypothetical protein
LLCAPVFGPGLFLARELRSGHCECVRQSLRSNLVVTAILAGPLALVIALGHVFPGMPDVLRFLLVGLVVLPTAIYFARRAR